MNRRSFLASLALVPVAAKALPHPSKQRQLLTPGLSWYITANRWNGRPPQPTEQDLNDFLEYARRFDHRRLP